MNEAGSLASVWPPADAEDGDYRRAPLGGTLLVASLGLDGGSRVVALARDAASAAWAVVPVVSDSAAAGGWRRALPGDGVAAALVAAIARGGGGLGDGFRLEVMDAAAAASVAASASGAVRASERAVGVDQTNESVVVGERLAVKWVLHPDPERERAPRLLRHLDAAGFREVPRIVGLLTWAPDPAGPPMTVALIDAWLPDARDGWEWCTEAVLAHAHPVHRCDGTCPAGFAPALGVLVARLHVALATPTAVIPDPVMVADATVVAGWATTAHRTLADALALTAADDRAAGAALADLAAMLESRLAPLETIGPTLVQPIHGDLHVGQVLHGPHGLALIDLDGNPVAEAASLQAPAPAARDVAGMQCSLDHVGRIAIHRGAQPAVVDAWIAGAQEALLAAYRASLDEADRAALFDERLLDPFRIEQECRELIYAARFLPRWRYAPMGADPCDGVSVTTPAQFLSDLEDKPAALARLAATLTSPACLRGVPRSPERIVLLGMGSSRYAAEVSAARLRAAGLAAVAELASAEVGTVAGPGTLAVVISANGESVETLAALERHRGRSQVVVITNRPASRAAADADTFLDLTAGEEVSGIACRTFQHTLLVLHALESHLTGAPLTTAALTERVAEATAWLLASRAAWLPAVADALEGPDGLYVIAPAERWASAAQAALMVREGPRRPATGCETGDWSHVDVYLTKTLEYRALLFTGSRWDAQALDWLARRGATWVAVGGEAPGARATVRYPDDGDAQVALATETMVAELVAQRWWAAQET